FILRAVDMAKRKDLGVAAAAELSSEALNSAYLGDCAGAFQSYRAAAALVNRSTMPTIAASATALGLCGDAPGALDLVEIISAQSTTDTLWIARGKPSILATIELRWEQPGRAIEQLKAAIPYERAVATPAYLRGLAYLQMGKGTEAAAEF